MQRSRSSIAMHSTRNFPQGFTRTCVANYEMQNAVFQACSVRHDKRFLSFHIDDSSLNDLICANLESHFYYSQQIFVPPEAFYCFDDFLNSFTRWSMRQCCLISYERWGIALAYQFIGSTSNAVSIFVEIFQLLVTQNPILPRSFINTKSTCKLRRLNNKWSQCFIETLSSRTCLRAYLISSSSSQLSLSVFSATFAVTKSHDDWDSSTARERISWEHRRHPAQSITLTSNPSVSWRWIALKTKRNCELSTCRAIESSRFTMTHLISSRRWRSSNWATTSWPRFEANTSPAWESCQCSTCRQT